VCVKYTEARQQQLSVPLCDLITNVQTVEWTRHIRTQVPSGRNIEGKHNQLSIDTVNFMSLSKHPSRSGSHSNMKRLLYYQHTTNHTRYAAHPNPLYKLAFSPPIFLPVTTPKYPSNASHVPLPSANPTTTPTYPSGLTTTIPPLSSSSPIFACAAAFASGTR